MKICFFTSICGDYEKVDKPGKFKRDKSFDYFLFTDIDKKMDTDWDIINLSKISKISHLDPIRKSRYPKFMAWELFPLVGLDDYDLVFYCDAVYTPNMDKDWDQLASKIISNVHFPFTQAEHDWPNVRTGGILEEARLIVQAGRDSRDSIVDTLNFLSNLDSSVNLQTSQYYENTCFGYKFSDLNIRSLMKEFWDIYSTGNISFRDQPLWNFLLLKAKLKPIINNNLKKPAFSNDSEKNYWFTKHEKLVGTMRNFYNGE